MISAVIMMILPPPFVLPLYIEETEKKEFYSSAISVYTMLSIVGFVCGSFALAYPKFYKNNIGYLSVRKSIGIAIVYNLGSNCFMGEIRMLCFLLFLRSGSRFYKKLI